MNDPYIGITGFTDRAEVEHALNFFPEDSSRRLMVGVLGSNHTLLHGKERPHTPDRYPHAYDVPSIFTDDPRCLNFIHYTTTEPTKIVAEIDQVVALAGPNLHGIQLNIWLPWPKWFAEIKQRHPQLLLVLQLNQSLMSFAGNRAMSPREMAVNASNYEADYVLIDRSSGTGALIGNDTGVIVEQFYDTTIVEYRKMMVGIAGGLSADTLPHIADILKRHPEVSIDAESCLRDAGDQLDPKKVEQYLTAAHAVYPEERLQW